MGHNYIGLICPYCGKTFTDEDKEIAICKICGTPYHTDCVRTQKICMTCGGGDFLIERFSDEGKGETGAQGDGAQGNGVQETGVQETGAQITNTMHQNLCIVQQAPAINTEPSRA